MLLCLLRFVAKAQLRGERHEFGPDVNEHPGDEDRFGGAAVLLPVVWYDSSGVSEKQFRLRQSFQSARPMRGRPCGPRFSTT